MTLAPVLRYIDRWGVPVVHVDALDAQVRRFPVAQLGGASVTHDAPYSYAGGIHWPTRTIVTALDGTHGRWMWEGCVLIHELSHVLVNIDPADVNEVDSPMLALDYIGCRLFKLSWTEWMEEFEVDGLVWPLMSRTSRASALATSRSVAREQGLLDAHNRPTFRRLQVST